MEDIYSGLITRRFVRAQTNKSAILVLYFDAPRVVRQLKQPHFLVVGTVILADPAQDNT